MDRRRPRRPDRLGETAVHPPAPLTAPLHGAPLAAGDRGGPCRPPPLWTGAVPGSPTRWAKQPSIHRRRWTAPRHGAPLAAGDRGGPCRPPPMDRRRPRRLDRLGERAVHSPAPLTAPPYGAPLAAGDRGGPCRPPPHGPPPSPAARQARRNSRPFTGAADGSAARGAVCRGGPRRSMPAAPHGPVPSLAARQAWRNSRPLIGPHTGPGDGSNFRMPRLRRYCISPTLVMGRSVPLPVLVPGGTG